MKRTKVHHYIGMIESTYWYAYAISSVWYGSWVNRSLMKNNVSPSYCLGNKARGIVEFDRTLNGEIVDETVS